MVDSSAAGDGMISGIDVSNHQKVIDWSKVHESGIRFCFIKASQGKTFKDLYFSSNRRQAKSNGIACGAYHFFDPLVPVNEQVENFIAMVERLEAGDLPPALDLERLGNPDHWESVQPGKRVELALAWLERVEEKLGVSPFVYLSPSFVTDVLKDATRLLQYNLWIAHWGTKVPRVPSPWSRWTFWQYTDKLTVEGIAAGVDGDRFNGSEDELKALVV